MNSIYVRAEGLNIDGFLRRLASRGVRVRSAQKTKPRLLKATLFCSCDKLFAIFGQTWYNKKKGSPIPSFTYNGCTVTVLKEKSPNAFFRAFMRLTGVWLGILAAAVFISCYAGSVRKIEICGAEKTDPQAVIAKLDSLGIAIGVKKEGLELKAIQGGILATFPDLDYVVASMHGVTLKISIHEGDNSWVNPQREGNLYAARSGLVTGIVVYSGTARVKIGDEVSAGDLLIEGVYLRQDGGVDLVEASGTVTGEFTVGFSRSFFGAEVVRYRTGNFTNTHCLSLFGKRFWADKDFASPYPSYDCEESQIAIIKYGALPLYRVTRTFYEIAYRFESRDIEQVRSEICTQLSAEADETAKLLSGEILSANFVDQDSTILLTVTIRSRLEA